MKHKKNLLYIGRSGYFMKEKSLQAHEMWKGKIEVISRCPVKNNEDLTIAYTQVYHIRV